MTEYIPREAVIEFGERQLKRLDDGEAYRRLDAWLNAIPAADVRPVVVCADCEHNNHCLTQEFVDDCGKIPLDRSTFFCADGERKSDV